jgi:hypothetical protein
MGDPAGNSMTGQLSPHSLDFSSSTTMATRRAVALARTTLSSQFTYDNVKTILLYYVLFTQSLKAKRHLRARGIPGTFREFWSWVSQVRPIFSDFHISLLTGAILESNISGPSCPSRKEKGSAGNGQSQVGH